MGGVSEEKYPSHGVEGVLEEKFGASRLSEALVSAYDIEMRHPHFFKSHDAVKKPDTKDVLMRDAARATSSAPILRHDEELNAMAARLVAPVGSTPRGS